MGEDEERTFAVILDRNSERFTGKDIVKGKVVLNSTKEESIKTVSITFEGRTKTKDFRHDGTTPKKKVFRGRVFLFRESVELFSGTLTHEANKRQEWPFEFSFPASIDPAALAENSDWTAGGMFSMTRQPLPPTFLDIAPPHLGTGHEAFVEYKLTATLSRPGGGRFFKRGYECIKVLQYVQPNLYEQLSLTDRTKEYMQEFTVHSQLLVSDDPDRSMSVVENVQRVSTTLFNKDKLPKFSFALTVVAPDCVHLGEQVPMAIRLRYSPEKSSPEIPNIPLVVLRSIDVHIVAYTTVRPNRGVDWHHLNLKEDKHRWHVHSTAETGEGPGPFLKVTDHEKTFNLDPLSYPAYIPNFATVNIVRRYRVFVDIAVQCAGATVKMHHMHQFAVLPGVDFNPETFAADQGHILGIDQVAGSHEQDGRERLPGYEAAPSYYALGSTANADSLQRPASSSSGSTSAGIPHESKPEATQHVVEVGGS